MLVRQVENAKPFGSSAYRRRCATVSTQVWLWRVGLAVALTCLVWNGVIDRRMAHAEKQDRALETIQKYAFEAYPLWAVTMPERACPRSLDELAPFADRPAIDPWGTQLAMKCGAPIRGVFVYSAGPDRDFETDDDISSNTVR